MRNTIKTAIQAFAVFVLFLLLLPVDSSAEFYRWIDSEGVLHVTDDLGRVPQSKRHGVQTYESTPADESPAPSPYVVKERKGVKAELYGDYPAEWWLNTLRKKRSDVQSIEAGIQSKKQFISLFEGGRRFGQIYETEDVKKYELFKVEILEDTLKLKTAQAELVELERKAVAHGVPEGVRGGG